MDPITWLVAILLYLGVLNPEGSYHTMQVQQMILMNQPAVQQTLMSPGGSQMIMDNYYQPAGLVDVYDYNEDY